MSIMYVRMQILLTKKLNFDRGLLTHYSTFWNILSCESHFGLRYSSCSKVVELFIILFYINFAFWICHVYLSCDLAQCSIDFFLLLAGSQRHRWEFLLKLQKLKKSTDRKKQFQNSFRVIKKGTIHYSQ